MLKHVIKEHDGIKENVKFTWKVMKKHTKPLKRQVSEAVNINNKNENENLNSKNEFNYHSVKKINLIKEKNSMFNCNACGALFNSQEELRKHSVMFHMKMKCMNCNYEAFDEKSLQYHLQTCENSPT